MLVGASHRPGISRDELAEIVQDAWLARASARRRDRWLVGNGA